MFSLQRDTPLNLRSCLCTLSQDIHCWMICHVVYSNDESRCSQLTCCQSQRQQFHHLVPKIASSSVNNDRQLPTTYNTTQIPVWRLYGCQHVLCACHGLSPLLPFTNVLRLDFMPIARTVVYSSVSEEFSLFSTLPRHSRRLDA